MIQILLFAEDLTGGIFEVVFSKGYKLACASIEASDQSAHLHSLIRVFDVHCMGSQGSQHFFRQITMTLRGQKFHTSAPNCE